MMLAVITLSVIITIAIVDSACLFNIWLSVEMDSETMPYAVAAVCVVLFIYTPYLVVGNFMRLLFSEDIPKSKSAVCFSVSLIFEVMLCGLWLGISQALLEMFSGSYIVSEDYDKVILFLPLFLTAVEMLILPPAFIKISGGRPRRRKKTDGTQNVPVTDSSEVKENLNETESESYGEFQKEEK